MQRKIKKVEVSSLFWNDLSDWRKHPGYPKIRADIGGMVSKMMRGEFAGDSPFRNKVWEDVRHLHVSSKLIVFLTYPDEETVKICALKKHDFYGFKNNRSNIERNSASVILRSAIAQSKPFPDWGRMSWRDPSEILDHPELLEMSREALDTLYQEICQEGEDFLKLRKATEGMTDKNASRIADAWLEDLMRAEGVVQDAILKKARYRHEHTPEDLLTQWSLSSDS